MLSREQLQQAAAESGFQVDSYEKTHMLVGLLEAARAHPFLGSRIALKGGTALSLFILDLPRLSVDIDLNYIGASKRETMLAERPRVDQALEQVFGRMGLTVKRVPDDHAGGKWRLAYTSALGRGANLEVDVNYMLRTPLWPIAPRDSRAIGGEAARRIPLLDPHELAIGKLAALFARSASRDLFDVRELLKRVEFDHAKLRLGFVVYGGMNREDWRSVNLENITTTAADVDSQLVPMLRSDMRPAKREVAKWTKALVSETRELVSTLLPLRKHEREFLQRLNGGGEIVPELLTSDPIMQATIQVHPGLKWKALNVMKRLGIASNEAPSP